MTDVDAAATAMRNANVASQRQVVLSVMWCTLQKVQGSDMQAATTVRQMYAAMIALLQDTMLSKPINAPRLACAKPSRLRAV